MPGQTIVGNAFQAWFSLGQGSHPRTPSVFRLSIFVPGVMPRPVVLCWLVISANRNSINSKLFLGSGKRGVVPSGELIKGLGVAPVVLALLCPLLFFAGPIGPYWWDIFSLLAEPHNLRTFLGQFGQKITLLSAVIIILGSTIVVLKGYFWPRERSDSGLRHALVTGGLGDRRSLWSYRYRLGPSGR